MSWSLGNRPVDASTFGRKGFKWWILPLIIGLGFTLVLLVSLSDPFSPTGARQDIQSPPEPEVGTTRTTAEVGEPFMDDYDPDAIPFLDDAAQATTSAETQQPAWLAILDIVAKLALVIGLLYGTLLALRWLQRRHHGRLNDAAGATIRVLETVGLTPGRSLHLVTVGEKTLLIGATDHQLSVLTEIADATVPLREEETAFDAELRQQAQANPDDILVQHLVEEETATSENAAEWRIAMDNLRAGVQGLRKSVEKPR